MKVRETGMQRRVSDEIASLELLAHLAEDMDQGAKAKRLRAKARKLRATLGLAPVCIDCGCTPEDECVACVAKGSCAPFIEGRCVSCDDDAQEVPRE